MVNNRYRILTEVFVVLNSVGPTGRLQDVIGKMPTDVLLQEVAALQRDLANKTFKYYQVSVPANGSGYNQKLIRNVKDGAAEAAERVLATGYNTAPMVNTAQPVGKPFRQRVAAATPILEADRAAWIAKFGTPPSGQKTIITNRADYIKIVNKEMRVSGRPLGASISKASAFHLSGQTASNR